jgi:hypothetical protein
MSETQAHWRRCSSCKEPIGFETPYWVCNVSTCNRKRTGLVFCSVSCWDAHVPLLRHRESWAEERRSPTPAQWAAEQAADREKAARRSAPKPSRGSSRSSPRTAQDAAQTSPPRPAPQRRDPLPRDILIVASKLKSYVRARSGMNTSDRVMDALSDRVRALCDEAIRKAERAERRTLLDRDFD